MSSFFLPAKQNRKRQKFASRETKHKTAGRDKSTRKKQTLVDEEIVSDSEDEGVRRAKGKKQLALDEFLDEEETAPEKRLRLAKEYLAQLDEEEKQQVELDSVDRDAIAHRLRDEVLERAGRLHKKVADQYSLESVQFYKGHRLPVVSVVVSPDEKHIYSGAKDCSIIKWDASTGGKEVILVGHRRGVEGVVGHTGHVLALAVSFDGKFVASGGTDCLIHIWDGLTSSHLHTFTGHRAAVSGLAFCRGSHVLFSCSFDRTVKTWNVDEMTYVETLFGHQDAVTGIDCLSRERPVTAGSNDRTVRLWKIVEESQLVFHGHKASIDAVCLLNEDHMFSGSQDGTIGVWSMLKKKPLVIQKHQLEEPLTSLAPREVWVTAVAALPFTDLAASGNLVVFMVGKDRPALAFLKPRECLVATLVQVTFSWSLGSCDGHIHLWKCGNNMRSLDRLFSVPVPGFVNSLAFSKHGRFLVAAVGQEHKFGRWWKQKGTRNGIVIICLCRKDIKNSNA